jgi:hypothetical protein
LNRRPAEKCRRAFATPRRQKEIFDMSHLTFGQQRRKGPETLAPKTCRRDAPVTCAGCGREVARRARQQRFCSARCKEKARTRVRKAFLTGDTGASSQPYKKDREFKALQRAKTLSSHRILAPEQVLAIEVFGGRVWQHATSRDGVVVEIGRIRGRALVERAS